MQPKDPSRRKFIQSSGRALSGSWLAFQLPAILAISDLACTAQTDGAPLQALNTVEALELEAMVAQIFPTDETPGAKEAGIIHFIDQAIVEGLDLMEEDLLRTGVQELSLGVGAMYPAAERFSELSQEQQIAYLKSVEHTEFFQLVNDLTITGMFVHPKYGGNRDKIGWNHLGFDNRHNWEPPFGYYDEEYMREQEQND